MRKWFDVSELMNALDLTRPGVLKKAKKEDWQSRPRKGRGGGKEYHLYSLPELAQNKLIISQQLSEIEARKEKLTPGTVASPRVSKKFSYSPESLWAYFDYQTDKKKAKARWMLDIINAVIKLHETTDNNLTTCFKLVGQIREIPYKTIYNWYYGKGAKRGIIDYDRADWLAALIPTHHGRVTTAMCTPDAWEFLKAEYLRLEQPNFSTSYRVLERVAAKEQWQIPSYDALKSKMKRDVPRVTQILLRKGEHELMRLYPPQERDVSELHALEWINGDGYTHNVFVLWPDGTIARPKTWFWQETKSRKMLTWRTDQTENADQIILCIGDLIEQYGIPQHATIDNTRAAANKWVTGRVKNRYRFKVKEDDPLGIFPSLGTQIHWTSVNNYSDSTKSVGWGQGKPIERAFGVGGLGEHVDKSREFRGAYTGPNTTSKPANYSKTAVPLKVFLEVLEREMHAWNARTGRRTQEGQGIYSFDQIFEKSYNQSIITKPTEEQRRMWLLSGEGVRVKHDGTFNLQAGSSIGKGHNRYFAHELYQLNGEKIIVRFDPINLHNSVYAYTVEGRFICECDCIQKTGFGDRLAAREHKRARTNMMKHVKATAVQQQKMDDLEADSLMPETDKPAPVAPKVVRGMFPQSKGANALKIENQIDEEEMESYSERLHKNVRLAFAADDED